jgi:hypothetical protein
MHDSGDCRECGHSVARVARSEEFLEATKTWELTHIPIDLKMPDMDGVDPMEELVRLGCTAKLIVFEESMNECWTQLRVWRETLASMLWAFCPSLHAECRPLFAVCPMRRKALARSRSPF